MRNPFEIMPKSLIEAFTFVVTVLFGTLYKLSNLIKKGIKLTFTMMLVEAFMSVFIAFIVYAVFDQFMNFNKIFTYSMCSLAGSLSTNWHDKLGDLADTVFDSCKKTIKKYF